MKTLALLVTSIIFVAQATFAQINLINFNDSWKYLDDGSDQGTAWKAALFNDSGWKTGQAKFGYGISDAATTVDFGPNASQKYVTTYFRKSITIDNPADLSAYTISAQRDDGIIVYVNGTVVWRTGFPSGSVYYNTLAAESKDNGTVTQTVSISSTPFKAGANVVAVEIHQASLSTPDMAFDMQLSATTRATADVTPPTVSSINRQSPTSETTNASTLTFRATFSEKVTGVDASDFTLTTVSGTATGAVSGLTSAGTSGNAFDVAVASVSGQGVLRLDLNASGTGIADASNNAIQAGYTAGQTYTIQQQAQEPPPVKQPTVGFASVTSLSPLSISTSTGEKPQSKVWSYAGKHWAVLPNSSGTYLWRLDGTTWTNVLKLSPKSSSKADCKLVDNIAHILLFQGASSQFVSVEYVAGSGTYKLWSRRTSTVGLTFDKGVETATIDMDSQGRMWLASDGTTSIYVRWSDAPYTNWSAPVTVGTGITDDDICAVIALPGKIGVLWSNQSTKRFGFKTHADGASPSSWSSDEVPSGQSALNVGKGMADDHLNMAVANDGTLYCGVKTSYDASNYPEMALLIRRPSGSWDKLYDVSKLGTRPIVVLNESNGKLRFVYTYADGGGDIVYKETSMSNISFSSQQVLIKGSYNNATSTKANFSSEIVILASSSTQAVGVLASDVASTAAAIAGVGAAASTEPAATADEPVVYPNPFTSRATLVFALPADGNYQAALYDMRGTKVAVLQEGNALRGEVTKVAVDGSNYAKGLYVVQLTTGKGTKAIKVFLDK